MILKNLSVHRDVNICKFIELHVHVYLFIDVCMYVYIEREQDR